MKYEIEILAEARKQIKKLQKRDLAIVTKKIDMLIILALTATRNLSITASIFASTRDDIG